MSPTLTGIGFLDLAGYTALTAVHGDESAADVVARLCGLVRASFGEGDELVKSIGDAVLVRSDTPVGLADLARRVCELVDAEPAFPVLRTGLHAGPVVVRDGDVFGTTVNVAARVAALAAGGQVLATRAVADALDEADVVRRLGAVPLKGLVEPVELVELALCPQPHERSIDPVCGMAVAPGAVAATVRVETAVVVFCSTECAGRYLQGRA